MSSSKRRIDQLLPESRALLSSIDDERAAAQNNRRRSFRAMMSTSSSSSSSAMLSKLFGGVGVAALAIASYVSGYKSYDHGTLLGDSTGGKVVLHTGCSPVAQLLVDTFEVDNLADWGEVVGARVSIHGLTGHTMTHAGCGRYEIEQDDDVQFHHDGPFEFTLFSSGVNETSVKERNANVAMHMTECTKEFTYDGQQVMQRVFDRDGDRHFVFGSCDHHCPGFYEDVLTHYGTACPADEKSSETVLPPGSTASNEKKCAPGSFTNTNGECEECPIGTYSDESGLTTCKRCQPGQFNPFPEAQGCMACPDGYFQPNWGQQYCVACDGDAALGKKEFALQGASKRKLLGGWWGSEGGWWGSEKDDEDDEDQKDTEMNHDQYHKIGATSLDQCGKPAVQQDADEYKKTQERENDAHFDATPGSSNEPINDGPNGPAATPVLTGRTDRFGHCVCPGTKPKPKPANNDGSSSSSSSSEVKVDPVTHVVAGQPCGPCAAVKPNETTEQESKPEEETKPNESSSDAVQEEQAKNDEMSSLMHVQNATLPLATCDEIEHGEYGVGYRGCQDKTRDGQQCIDWADQYVADGEKPYTHENYPEGIEENPGNMCRNPANDKSGIWCFTGTDGSWQVCSPLTQAEAE